MIPTIIISALESLLDIFQSEKKVKDFNEFKELEKYFKNTGDFLNKAMNDLYQEQDDAFKEKIDKKLDKITSHLDI